MKNLLHETSTEILHGRRLYSIKLIPDKDIRHKRILDIGCGFGWCEIDFLNRGAKEIVATEVSSSDLTTLRSSLKHPRLTTRVAGATHLPFPKNSFDTVVCWEVIEHIPPHTEDTMFSQVFRVLKPGGSFYLSTPFSHPVSRFLDPAWWLIHHRHYSREQLETYAKNHGLVTEKVYIRGRIWEAVFILDLYFSKWILRRPPILGNFLDRLVDIEYGSPGYIGIFIKYRKLNK